MSSEAGILVTHVSDAVNSSLMVHDIVVTSSENDLLTTSRAKKDSREVATRPTQSRRTPSWTKEYYMDKG